MPRPARGPHRLSRRVLRLTRRRVVAGAALTACLAIPAGLFGGAFSSFYAPGPYAAGYFADETVPAVSLGTTTYYTPTRTSAYADGCESSGSGSYGSVSYGAGESRAVSYAPVDYGADYGSSACPADPCGGTVSYGTVSYGADACGSYSPGAYAPVRTVPPSDACCSSGGFDGEIIESAPVYADPPRTDEPRTDEPRRGRDRPAPPALENGGDPLDDPLPGPDNRPRGNPYDLPEESGPPPAGGFGEEGDFGEDPLTDSDSSVRPADGELPYRRPRGGAGGFGDVADPPDERTRPLPPPDSTDESFPPLDDGFGGPPGEPAGDGFGGAPGEPAGDGFDDAFGLDADPAAPRESYRLQPDPVDLTGPPDPDESAADDPADREPADGEPALPADPPADGAADDGSADPAPPAESAAAAPRLITAEPRLRDFRRTRVPLRPGRTRIARFRHRIFVPPGAAVPPGPPGGADVQIAAQ